MTSEAPGRLQVDSHSYFFTTYLAARLAGLDAVRARQLAVYCQAMAEQQYNQAATQPWFYRDNRFAPIVTINTGAVDDLTIAHCELAFRRLPAFESRFNSSGVPVAFTREGGQQSAAKHVYHPLTDIDWQKGGRFKSSFSRKIAVREAQLNQQNRHHRLSGQQFAPGLDCIANSRFCRTMLNDTIYQSRYCDKGKRIDLALLGCRLFVYQNSWFFGSGSEGQSQADVRLQIFYWTLYAIECFVKGKSMEDKLRFNWSGAQIDSALLQSTLRALYAFKGDALEREFMWLEQLPALLACYGIYQPHQHYWWAGFRYQAAELVEYAMIDSGSGLSRDIQLLSGFKGSGFYKLNMAAQYHADWLGRHLNIHGLSTYQSNQSCGDALVWQL